MNNNTNFFRDTFASMMNSTEINLKFNPKKNTNDNVQYTGKQPSWNNKRLTVHKFINIYNSMTLHNKHNLDIRDIIAVIEGNTPNPKPKIKSNPKPKIKSKIKSKSKKKNKLAKKNTNNMNDEDMAKMLMMMKMMNRGSF